MCRPQSPTRRPSRAASANITYHGAGLSCNVIVLLSYSVATKAIGVELIIAFYAYRVRRQSYYARQSTTLGNLLRSVICYVRQIVR